MCQQTEVPVLQNKLSRLLCQETSRVIIDTVSCSAWNSSFTAKLRNKFIYYLINASTLKHMLVVMNSEDCCQYSSE